MLRRLSLTLLLSLMPQPMCLCIFGQGLIASSEQQQAMKKLDLWVGQWKGSGWAISETGQRFNFNLIETVQRKVGGTVLLVEGRGTRKANNGDEVTTHDGITLVYYNSKAQQYLWNGHEQARKPINAELKPVDGGMEWFFKIEDRGATIRFTIKLSAKRWYEVGEISLDGKTWNKLMEVTLERQ